MTEPIPEKDASLIFSVQKSVKFLRVKKFRCCDYGEKVLFVEITRQAPGGKRQPDPVVPRKVFELHIHLYLRRLNSQETVESLSQL